MDGAALGTLFAVMLGSAVSLGNRVGRTCTWEGVPVCSGWPQPPNTSAISSMYQRRTIAYNALRTSVLFKVILPRANGGVKRMQLGKQRVPNHGTTLMSPAILYTVFKLLASVPKVPSNTALDYTR